MSDKKGTDKKDTKKKAVWQDTCGIKLDKDWAWEDETWDKKDLDAKEFKAAEDALKKMKKERKDLMKKLKKHTACPADKCQDLPKSRGVYVKTAGYASQGGSCDWKLWPKANDTVTVTYIWNQGRVQARDRAQFDTVPQARWLIEYAMNTWTYAMDGKVVFVQDPTYEWTYQAMEADQNWTGADRMVINMDLRLGGGAVASNDGALFQVGMEDFNKSLEAGNFDHIIWVFLHELGHGLGLCHEFDRSNLASFFEKDPDLDLAACITTAFSEAFVKSFQDGEARRADWVGVTPEYDFGSVMNYPVKVLGVRLKSSLGNAAVLGTLCRPMGKFPIISKGDVDQLWAKYAFGGRPSHRAAVLHPNFFIAHGDITNIAEPVKWAKRHLSFIHRMQELTKATIKEDYEEDFPPPPPGPPSVDRGLSHYDDCVLFHARREEDHHFTLFRCERGSVVDVLTNHFGCASIIVENHASDPPGTVISPGLVEDSGSYIITGATGTSGAKVKSLAPRPSTAMRAAKFTEEQIQFAKTRLGVESMDEAKQRFEAGKCMYPPQHPLSNACHLLAAGPHFLPSCFLLPEFAHLTPPTPPSSPQTAICLWASRSSLRPTGHECLGGS